jgi:hypothetical protein
MRGLSDLSVSTHRCSLPSQSADRVDPIASRASGRHDFAIRPGHTGVGELLTVWQAAAADRSYREGGLTKRHHRRWFEPLSGRHRCACRFDATTRQGINPRADSTVASN